MEWLTGLGYGLGSFFLIVGVVILVLGKFSSTAVESFTSSVINELGAYGNSTGYTLSYSGAEGFNSPSITAAWNSSVGGGYNVSIPTGNFSVSNTGVVTNSTALSWNNVSLSYSYGYNTGTNTSAAMNYGIAQLGQNGLLGWTPAIIAIVIGVFFLSYFMGKGGSGRRYR